MLYLDRGVIILDCVRHCVSLHYLITGFLWEMWFVLCSFLWKLAWLAQTLNFPSNISRRLREGTIQHIPYFLDPEMFHNQHESILFFSFSTYHRKCYLYLFGRDHSSFNNVAVLFSIPLVTAYGFGWLLSAASRAAESTFATMGQSHNSCYRKRFPRWSKILLAILQKQTNVI